MVDNRERKTAMRRVIAVGVIAGTLTLAGTPAPAREHLRCEGEVADRLAALSIDDADVAGISTVPKYVARAQFGLPRVSSDFDGVTAWVSLNSCKGSLVIDLNRRCRINQTWSRGECRVPGVKSF